MCGLGLLVVDVVWWWLLSLVWFSYYVYGLGVFSCVNFYRLRVFGFLVVCGMWMLCLVCLWFVASSGWVSFVVIWASAVWWVVVSGCCCLCSFVTGFGFVWSVVCCVCLRWMGCRLAVCFLVCVDYWL